MTGVKHEQNAAESHREGEPGSRQISFEPGSDVVSDALLEAVVSVGDIDPENLPRLDEIVDMDALDSLFKPHVDGRPRQPGSTLSFRYAEYDVCVYSGGFITLDQSRATPE